MEAWNKRTAELLAPPSLGRKRPRKQGAAAHLQDELCALQVQHARGFAAVRHNVIAPLRNLSYPVSVTPRDIEPANPSIGSGFRLSAADYGSFSSPDQEARRLTADVLPWRPCSISKLTC